MKTDDTALFDNSFLPLLSRVLHEYTRRFHQRWNLPLALVMVLVEIAKLDGRAEPAAVAETLCIPRQTMTSLLDMLEKRALARRLPHPADRRRKVLRLTPEGARLADAIVSDALRSEAAAIRAAVIDPAELPRFRAAVIRYIAALAAQNDAAPSRKDAAP